MVCELRLSSIMLKILKSRTILVRHIIHLYSLAKDPKIVVVNALGHAVTRPSAECAKLDERSLGEKTILFRLKEQVLKIG